MTVCIGAIADILSPGSESIVLAVDQMLSLQGETDLCADGSLIKLEPFMGKHWCVLFAGDVATATSIKRRATTDLISFATQTEFTATLAENKISPQFGDLVRDVFGTGLGHERAEVNMMAGAICSAYREELKAEATAQVLGRFGLTMEAFLKDGLSQFGERAFHELFRSIESINFDVEFLVAGYDARKVPHLLSVANPGVVRDYTRLGYWTMGMGGRIAMMSMASHSFTSLRTVEEAIYHALEAKFMAENAPGVGTATTLMIQWPGRSEFLDVEAIAEIRCLWLGWGKAQVPKRAFRRIEKIVRSFKPQLAPRKSRLVQ